MRQTSKTESVIEQAYDCVVEEAGWNRLLASYAELVGAESGLIYLKSRNVVAGTSIASVNYDVTAKLAKFLTYYEARSPIHALYRKLPEADVRALGQLAFSREYRETEFFQDWARPQGYADMFGSHLVRTSHLHAWLSLRRAERRGAYTLAEVRAAKRIAPHVGRAVKLRSRLAAESSKAGSLRETLEMLGFGVLIVDVNAKVLMANRSADLILNTGDGLQTYHGRLACTRPDETSAVHHAIRVLAQASNATDLYVSRGDGRRPLTLQVLPISPLSAFKGFTSPTAIAAVFVVDPTTFVTNVNGFGATYALTTSEGRVLREILLCVGLVDAAENLGIAVPTARTHLQHIFSKTGTTSQAELVQLVMRSSLQLKSKQQLR